MPRWTILTCEYPPDCGGVGDYTAQVAAALADAGDSVTVVCPPGSGLRPAAAGSAIEVLVLEDAYGRAGRRTLDARLNGEGASGSTVLVQYVPTGFGLRGANVPFCRWLLSRARRHQNDVRVMFHEPYFEFTWTPIRQNALAAAERLMAGTLLRAASHVYLSTDAWRRYLEPHAPGGDGAAFETLPIPSAIPRCVDAKAIADRRHQLLGPSSQLVGHFGTFGAQVAPMVAAALTSLLDRRSDVSAVCTGAGSDAFVERLVNGHPRLRDRLHGTGRLAAAGAAVTIAACDALVQPYPDGVTTRRTSTMAGLINSRPVVTTAGHLTEPIWAATGAVALSDAGDARALVEATHSLLSAEGDRAALAARGERVYRERFALDHTIRALRKAREGTVA